MAAEAITHLLAARSMRGELSKESRAVLLPATVADLLLLRLQRCGWSPYAPEVVQPLGVRLQLALAWHSFRSAY